MTLFMYEDIISRIDIGCVQANEGLFDALDAIENYKNRHPSTCMDILRHLHNESCDE